jgi:hypothetical protein
MSPLSGPSPPTTLSPPAWRPPEGRPAVRVGCVLASSGSSGFHCGRLVWRPHVVCVKSAAGVVALLPFHAPAVPFAAAAIPPHCPIPPPSHSPRHFAVVFRGYAATHARKTPCHIQQQPIQQTNQDPKTQNCLILRCTSGHPARCALSRTLIYSHPWSLSPLKGRARCFRCGARLARGGAPAEEGGGPSPPTPAIARA